MLSRPAQPFGAVRVQDRVRYTEERDLRKPF